MNFHTRTMVAKNMFYPKKILPREMNTISSKLDGFDKASIKRTL